MEQNPRRAKGGASKEVLFLAALSVQCGSTPFAFFSFRYSLHPCTLLLCMLHPQRTLYRGKAQEVQQLWGGRIASGSRIQLLGDIMESQRLERAQALVVCPVYQLLAGSVPGGVTERVQLCQIDPATSEDVPRAPAADSCEPLVRNPFDSCDSREFLLLRLPFTPPV